MMNATISREESLSEIQSLTTRVASLSQAVDWWNTAMILALIGAAIAALAVVVTTRIVITRAKELSDVQQELMIAKDAKLAIDLRDKDAKISETNARAEEARAEASKANLELERLRAPRTLSAEQQVRMAEKLKSFHGTTFEMVTYPGLPEPSEFSAILASLLTRAEWSIWLHPGRHSLLGIGSGVIIVVSTQAPPRADEAGKALLASLISEGVAAKLGYDSLKLNPIKIAIQIQVGTKQ